MSVTHQVIVDGGLRQGVAAAAVLIYKNSKLVGQYRRTLSCTTSNIAELEAVLVAIELCWASGIKSPVIYTDSEYVYRIVADQQAPDRTAAILLASLKEILKEFAFTIERVQRRDVAAAHDYVTDLLDKVVAPLPPSGWEVDVDLSDDTFPWVVMNTHNRREYRCREEEEARALLQALDR